MKRKVSKILFVIALIFAGILISNINKSYAAEKVVGDFTYVYDLVDGNAENVYISKYQNEPFSKSHGNAAIEMPNELDGHTIKSIGNGSLNILGKSMEDTIQGEYETQGILVMKMTLPENITTINLYAFAGITITSDQGITIPNGVKSIDNWAFANLHYSVLFYVYP